MKKIIYIVSLLLIVLSCKENTVEIAPEDEGMKATEINAEAPSEEVVLFDGTDLNAWRGYGQDEMFDNWTIEGDAMVFTPGREGGKNIITKDTYKNFILSLEWKISEGGNSGIFWGVKELPQYKEAYETGPEIQVLDDERHPDAKVANGTHKAGSLYDMIKPEDGMILPAGEWNSVQLTINHKKNLGTVVLNGKEAYTFPVHGEAWDKMVSTTKFATWEGFGKYPEGHIGLQDHGDKVWYRNINIQEID